jgi:hypothetical protein
MGREYDLFETLSDGGLIRREMVPGHQNAVPKLLESAKRTSNMPLERRRRGYLAWWGCSKCPFEYPKKPVPMSDLERAPEHKCPNDGLDTKAVLNSPEQ